MRGCAGSKAGNEKGFRGAEKQRVSKRTTALRAIKPIIDLAALEGKASPLRPFTQRRGGAPPSVAHSWGQDGAAAAP